MKKERLFWKLPLAALLVPLVLSAAETTRQLKLEPLWKSLRESEEARQPQSASRTADEIFRKASTGGDWAQATSALVHRIAIESSAAKDPEVTRIRALEKELPSLPPVARATATSVLAGWYWDYYENNSWNFAQRSHLSQKGKDFTEWDLEALFHHVAALHDAALSDDEPLRREPISRWSWLVEARPEGNELRPTLFDFLAFEALSFLKNARQAFPLAQDAVVFSVRSEAFAPAEKFLRWNLAGLPPDDSRTKALRTFQRILRAHPKDSSPFIDADLERLAFVRENMVDEEADTAYLERLSALRATHPKNAAAAVAGALQAGILHGKGRSREAHDLALALTRQFPGSRADTLSRTTLASITSRSLSVAGRSPLPPRTVNRLPVTSRNVGEAWFKIVKSDWLTSFRQSGRGNAERLRKADAIKSWSVKLPRSENFEERSLDLEIPALEPGHYELVASGKPDFSDADNDLRVVRFFVSPLGLTWRMRGDSVEGTVRDAGSGDPLAQVPVTLWRVVGDDLKAAQHVKTDAQGSFKISFQKNGAGQPAVLSAEREGARIGLLSPVYLYPRYDAPAPSPRQVLFFTDRALYRPGQEIQFKALSFKRARGKLEVANDDVLKAELVDANGTVVASQNLRTNAHGTASARFRAPENGALLGQFFLRAPGLTGRQSLRIEEYKKPKFDVKLTPPEEQVALGDAVKIVGRALSYSGVPLAGATVRYRVERTAHIPLWWLWRHAWDFIVPMEPRKVDIAAGNVVADAQGRFTLPFEARPDPSVPREASARFQFRVKADVVDATQEIQSDTMTLSLGDSALEPRVEAPSFVEKGEAVGLTLSALGASGRPQSFGKGDLRIFALKTPDRPRPPAPRPNHEWFGSPPEEWRTWENGREAFRSEVHASGNATATQFAAPALEAGAYRAELEVRDAKGKKNRAETTFLVIDPKAAHFPAAIFSFLTSRSARATPGTTFEAWWGTGFERGRALVEVEKGAETLSRSFTTAGRGLERITIPITEAHRGGLALRVTFLREHGFEEHVLRIDVPWDNEIPLSTATFRSQLEPGKKETWTLRIGGTKSLQKAAELVATLYDASLDAIHALEWPRLPALWPSTHTASSTHSPIENAPLLSFGRGFSNPWFQGRGNADPGYPAFVSTVASFRGGSGYGGRSMGLKSLGAPSTRIMSADAAEGNPEGARSVEMAPAPAEAKKAPENTPRNETQVRRNLADTALFAPHLGFDAQGVASLTFEVPDTLTTWRLAALAHTPEMVSGFLTADAVSSKKLMVEPFLPRFLRSGDEVLLSARVSNRESTKTTASGRIRISDATTGRDLTPLFVDESATRELRLDAQESKALNWRVRIPKNHVAPVSITFSAAATGTSDGEEQTLPVLSDKVFLTDSKAFFAREAGEKKILFPEFQAGFRNPENQTLGFAVEYTPNAAWTVIGALGWLAEYPFESSEQVFNRLYANALATHITTKVPEIERTFAQWRKSPSPLPLERNSDLKKAALTETPWLLEAQSEAERRASLARLFERKAVADAVAAHGRRLTAMALSEGAWPWYPGGPASEVITLHVVTGLARLKALGMNPGVDPSRALAWLDRRFSERHQAALRAKSEPVATPDVAYWLQARARLGADKSAAVTFWTQALERDANRLPLLSQAHALFALHQAGRTEAVARLEKSLRERALHDPEMGMSWAEYEQRSPFWYQSPVETQAALIDAFSEVLKDPKAVAEMKVWLVMHKRTQAWSSPRATADAVFALLLRGEKPDLDDELPRLSVGSGQRPLAIAKGDAGSGYVRKSFPLAEVGPDLGELHLQKSAKTVSWGAMHWQYLAPLSQVKAQGGDLALERSLLVEESARSWRVLTGPVKPGSRLRVRVVIDAKRDLEFVHLRDLRAAGLEPTDALSGYRSQEGLWYYEMTRDTGTDFFIDFLPRGRHVFEYELKVQHAGDFDGGHADAECLYAPEFRGRSAAWGRVRVQP